MKKFLNIALIASFALATQTTEQIIKKEFDSNIAPVIVTELNKNGESVILIRAVKSQNGVTIQTYKIKKLTSRFIPYEKPGDYSLGFKYYSKYIFKPAKIKVTDFVKIIGAKTKNDLDKLFANNGELLIKKLEEQKQTYALEGVKTIIKKGKLNDLKAFIQGVMEGKVPASCS